MFWGWIGRIRPVKSDKEGQEAFQLPAASWHLTAVFYSKAGWGRGELGNIFLCCHSYVPLPVHLRRLFFSYFSYGGYRCVSGLEHMAAFF